MSVELPITEEMLIDLLYRNTMGLISKHELKSIIEQEKKMGVFNLHKSWKAQREL